MLVNLKWNGINSLRECLRFVMNYCQKTIDGPSKSQSPISQRLAQGLSLPEMMSVSLNPCEKEFRWIWPLGYTNQWQKIIPFDWFPCRSVGIKSDYHFASCSQQFRCSHIVCFVVVIKLLLLLLFVSEKMIKTYLLPLLVLLNRR